MKSWKKYMWYALIIFWIVVSLKTDDSDTSFWNRSGFRVHTDAKTKLQYISAGWFGSPLPRLDENGKHMKAE